MLCFGIKAPYDTVVYMKYMQKSLLSLVQLQSLLLPRVAGMTNFWRKAALNCKREQKPQMERELEWREDYDKNKLGNQRKTSQGIWAQLETGEQEVEKVAEARRQEAQKVAERGGGSRERQRRKEESWSLSTSDDSWYKAPQFRPEVLRRRKEQEQEQEEQEQMQEQE